MDSSPTQSSNDGPILMMHKEKEVQYASMVDPFLVEALQNPRHRLTILRMELDIQRFLQCSDQLQFEFQHFPTSYLRLAAHRVAQHYGLRTMVLDNVIDGPGTKIVVRKTAESKYPTIRLSEIPMKQSENSQQEPVKIAIKPRPNRNSGDANEFGMKRSPVRTVEEREEEYDRARARIFSSPSNSSSDEMLSEALADVKKFSSSKDDNGWCRNFMTESDKSPSVKDVGGSSRVAIFRDREKDRTDPDYDRSYQRYVRNFPSNQRFPAPFDVPKFQPPFVQYNAGFPQLSQMPRSPNSLNYGPSMSQFCTMGLNQASRDAMYMQWPSPAMMYAHSYEQLRHGVFQVPFCQQPLSFDYSQNL